MRICFLSDGRSVHTYRFVKYFADCGHDVTLVSIRPVREDIRRLNVKITDYRVTVHNFALFAAINLVLLPFVLWHIRRLNPDILHAHDAFCYGPFAWLSRRRYILTPWGSDVLVVPLRSVLIRSLLRRVVTRATRVLYDGGAHMLSCLLALGAVSGKLCTFSFGVDLRVFSRSHRDETVRRELGADTPSTPIVISTRSFEPVYDLATFIRAAHRVLHDEPLTRFVLVGDGTLRRNLETLAMELGIADRIVFTGKVTPEHMACLLASADIYVSTSLSDAGLAASTAEAMACGLPVIATDFGDNGNWIQEGINGFLFPAGNADALSRNIVRMLGSPQLRNSTGDANIETIRIRNNYDTEMQRVAELYVQTSLADS